MRVVHVRDVRMLVPEALVMVGVRVRLSRRVLRAMLMLVMGIMDMGMSVLHGFVNVLVIVLLGQVQPYTDRH